MRWREVRTVQVVYEKYRALLSVVLVTVSFIISKKCGAESVRNFKEAAGESLRSKIIDRIDIKGIRDNNIEIEISIEIGD